MSQPKIRVAISGGGIAGATLLHALLNHQHLDVHIFESAPAFKQSGMAIGIARNAYQALELIGPSAVQCLEDAGSVAHRGVKFMLATGPDAGQMVDEIDAKKDGMRLTSIVHRAAFLKELLANVPSERMHASKKLNKVDRKSDGSLTLHFGDGFQHECDVLVGADGIHSMVRRLILGEKDLAASPVPSGQYATLSLQPYDKMKAILGDHYVDTKDAREWGWFGDGAFMMHNVLSEGGVVQFIASLRDYHPEDTWFKEVSAVEVKTRFEGWPTHLREALDAIVGDEKAVKCLCHWEHLPARTYVDGPICVLGDAAHATTPWQGSGGGMSIEDAFLLSSLLGKAKSSMEAITALQVYDEFRRPRTQQIVKSSHETGLIFTGRNPDYPLELETLKGRLPQRWDFILDYDNSKARDDALDRFQSLL